MINVEVGQVWIGKHSGAVRKVTHKLTDSENELWTEWVMQEELNGKQYHTVWSTYLLNRGNEMINNVGEMLVKNILETIEEIGKVLSGMNMNGYDKKLLQQQLLSATNTIETIIEGYKEEGLITQEQYNTLDDALDNFYVEF